MASQYLARSSDRATQYALGDDLLSDPNLRVSALSPANYCAGAHGSACSTLVQRVGRADRRGRRSRQANNAFGVGGCQQARKAESAGE